MKFFNKLPLALVCLHSKCASLSFDRNEWMQVSPNVAFQRNADLTMDSSTRNHATDLAINRMLSSSSAGYQYTSSTDQSINPSYMYQNADSSAEYNEYALAWRLLGYYMDCQYQNNNRFLKKDDEGAAGCKRLVLYGVYANPKYEGGGIGEYAYYDKNSNQWLCYGSGSCITPMDCHLPDTQWKLLGVFKIDNISRGDGWMEQLFKHEGICVWGTDTYQFASNMREKVPQGCKTTSQTLENGTYLYYGAKPEQGGKITLGLYTDSMCSKEYAGDETFDVFQLAGSDESYWTSFNEALDIYKQCQPCISYDLSVSGFDCYDDAGYTNCNQCMKFSNKAGCKHADMTDIKLASKQNGLVSFNMHGTTFGGVGFGGLDQQTYAMVENKSLSVQQSHSVLLATLFFILGAAAFAKTSKGIIKSRQRNSKATSPALLDGFTPSKKVQTRLLRHMYRNFEKAKVKLTFVGDQDNAELFGAPCVQPESENRKKLSTSIKKVGSRFLKKLSTSIWPAESGPENLEETDLDPVNSRNSEAAAKLTNAAPSVEKQTFEGPLSNNQQDAASTHSDDTSLESNTYTSWKPTNAEAPSSYDPFALKRMFESDVELSAAKHQII